MLVPAKVVPLLSSLWSAGKPGNLRVCRNGDRSFLISDTLSKMNSLKVGFQTPWFIFQAKT